MNKQEFNKELYEKGCVIYYKGITPQQVDEVFNHVRHRDDLILVQRKLGVDQRGLGIFEYIAILKDETK